LEAAARPTSFLTARTGGPANIQDYYRIVLPTLSDLRVNLSGLREDLDVQLLDASGRVIGSSLSSATGIENILALGLSSGNYYVRVFDASRTSPSNYDLGVSVATIDDDLITKSTSLGTLNTTTLTTVTSTGTAGGPADTQDYYGFTLIDSTELRVNLSGLTANLDWQLLDDQGRIVVESNGVNHSVQNMVLTGLATGPYRLRVFGFSGESSYELTVSTLADNNNNLENATMMTPSLPLQPRFPTVSRSGTVGEASDQFDYFNFYLALANTVRLNLSGLSSDLDVELLDSTGAVIASGNRSGTSIENVTATDLPEGDYYVRVYVFTGASDYDLTVTVETESDNIIANANDLGILDSATRNTAFASRRNVEDNDQDYYKIRLNAPSDLRLNLSGLTDNAQLRLFDSSGRLITSASSAFSSGLSSMKNMLVTGLAADTYFILLSDLHHDHDFTVSVATSSANLITNAFNAGTVPKTIAGRVESKDLQKYMKFTAPESRDYRITLSRLSDDLGIELLDENGRYITSGSSISGFDRRISFTLTAGNYYVRIYSMEPSINSEFEVSFQFDQ
jgi:hypothetical protein